MRRSQFAITPEELFELAVRRDRKGRVRVSASLQRDVYNIIDFDAGRGGISSLSQQEIADLVGDGMTRQTVNEAIAGLVEVDLISVERFGKGRRYYVHHRGVRAPIQMRHPLEDAPDVSGHPDTFRPRHVGASRHVADPDMSGHPDTFDPDMSGHPDTSGDRTSLRIREEEEVNQPDPDPPPRSIRIRTPREIETAPCPEHTDSEGNAIHGNASLTTPGWFYHPLPGGGRHDFVPEHVAADDPYGHVYRRD